MEQKQKMSNHKFRCIWIPIISILCVLAVLLTTITNLAGAAITSYLGYNKKGGSDVSYYDKKYQSDTESQAAAAKVTEEVTDEGIVLLKNNGILPLEKGTEVTPFGYRYISPIYGGTGSGNVDASQDYIWTPQEALGEYFTLNTTMSDALADMQPMRMDATVTEEAEVSENNSYNGASTDLVEYAPDNYSADLLNSAKGSVGVIFIGRCGGEGNDLQRTAYADGTPHELALTSYEKDMIAIAKKNCDATVAIIDSSNVVELGVLMSGDYEVDAIVWIGGPGSTGFKSMAKVMCGEINPSGKTVDIYPADLTADPTYVNSGEMLLSNTDGVYSFMGTSTFVEYEEGIYEGYRYYETANDIGASGFDYDKAVVFPFGYGLSYTSFEQHITDFTEDENSVTVTVEVTNTGDVAGKSVVELYYEAPYTQLDQDYQIEKSTVNLAAYDKTELLNPGETETLKLTWAKEDMASYCETINNADGTVGCYMLEAGDYTISLREDSHAVLEKVIATIDDTIWYHDGILRQSDKDAQSEWDADGNPTGVAAATESGKTDFVCATNQFQDSTDYMNGLYAEEDGTAAVVRLTRRDWDNTQPTAPETMKAPAAVLEKMQEQQDFVPTDDNAQGTENTGSFDEEADNGIVLSDMRGLDYNDEKWDLFLDQINYKDSEIADLLNMQPYATTAYNRLGIPATMDLDGPQGMSRQMHFNSMNWCAYASEPVLASTWNVELAYKLGEAVGQEALTTDVTGWYAPGINTHRNQFGGRAFEYFSEDPLLSGTMAAAEVSGCGDQGLICDIKHFALNDQEAGRVGSLTWADEQTMREIYLKAFELCIKNAKMTVTYTDENGQTASKVMRATNEIMTAANFIGTVWCSENSALNVAVLRDEWGYQGIVSTDMAMAQPKGDASTDRMFYNGTDNHMSLFVLGFLQNDDQTAEKVTRRAVKNMCYVLANSNAMEGLSAGEMYAYGMPSWKKAVVVIDSVIAVFTIAMIAFMVYRQKDEQKNSGKYKERKRKKNRKKCYTTNE